ncbi:MAG: OmpA family protein [Allomuricauda sp.]|nr:MAG: OmpA family protein [Allomuricauda sp.]
MERKYFGAFLAVCFMALPNFSNAQNLIVDGSFEEYNSCPSKTSSFHHYFDHISAPTTSSGDYFNTCGSSDYSVPGNFKGEQEAAEGDGYVGIYLYALNDYREYVQLNTAQTLKQGYPYKVRIRVSLADHSALALKNMSLVLGNRKIVRPSSSALSYAKLDLMQGFDFYRVNLTADGSLGEKDGWVTLSAEFVAKGFENHMILGNFQNNVDTQLLATSKQRETGDFSYYYFDDVSLTELPITQYDSDKIYVLERNPYEPKGYKLDASAMASVEKIFDYLKRNSEVQLKITGHSNDAGTPEYNKFVSSLRARAVALYLKKLGIDESRIVWEGLGESRPLKNGKIKQSHLANSRVEFVMTEFDDN